ncbi:MAG TPA: ANTAR domain-containing protein [Armatimonadetes bacterium]|nr:ANTAR domain-containing protein [Armatimonadota bacterium]
MGRGHRILILATDPSVQAEWREILEAVGGTVVGHTAEVTQMVSLMRQYQPEVVLLTAEQVEAWQAYWNERKLIERAKGMLMQARRLSEAEAHRWLQQEARRAQQRLVEVARAVLTSHELLFLRPREAVVWKREE